MKEYLEFLASLSSTLYSAYLYADRGNQDPAVEEQLAMSIMREISDYRMRRQLQKNQEMMEKTNPGG